MCFHPQLVQAQNFDLKVPVKMFANKINIGKDYIGLTAVALVAACDETDAKAAGIKDIHMMMNSGTFMVEFANIGTFLVQKVKRGAVFTDEVGELEKTT